MLVTRITLEITNDNHARGEQNMVDTKPIVTCIVGHPMWLAVEVSNAHSGKSELRLSERFCSPALRVVPSPFTPLRNHRSTTLPASTAKCSTHTSLR